jgi:hypothetical protein
LIPAWHEGQFDMFAWGNRDRRSKLPITGWVRVEELKSGIWGHLCPEPVDIPACLGFEKGI